MNLCSFDYTHSIKNLKVIPNKIHLKRHNKNNSCLIEENGNQKTYGFEHYGKHSRCFTAKIYEEGSGVSEKIDSMCLTYEITEEDSMKISFFQNKDIYVECKEKEKDEDDIKYVNFPQYFSDTFKK